MSGPADFYAWSHEQAGRLRDAAAAGVNLPVDWAAVAEEIEDLGNSRRDALESRIATVIEHLLKLEFSPAQDPRRGWTETVLRSRDEINRLLRRNPSLRPEIGGMVADQAVATAHLVVRVLSLYGEVEQGMTDRILRTSYTADQVIGDWFPEASQP